jgi:beta-glucosidase
MEPSSGTEGPSTSRSLLALVSQLTLDEKAALTAGIDLWHTAAIPRLGIKSVKLTDGPVGARGATVDHESVSPSCCMPSPTALGATFDPDLVGEVAEAVAHQARDKGARVLLAPTVNLHRHPLWGRNFEAFSEDPVLSGVLAVAYVRGAQRAGVAATIKHLVGNETEHERRTSSSVVDERTLRELYLLPFEYGVRIGNVRAVMTSYNRLNGRHLADDARLLSEVLRGEWGFEGFVMTDWWALASTTEAAAAGLDLEMPGPGRAFGPALAAAVRAGQVAEEDLDVKVLRMLGVFQAIGALDDPPEADEAPRDRPEDRALARRAAADALVLCRNDGILPLDPKTIRSLAVVGPNADRLAIMGGGSAAVRPFATRSLLEVLRERLGDDVVLHLSPVEPAEVGEVGEVGEEAILAAVELARVADVAVVVVGTNATIEREGEDRVDFELAEGQAELVKRVLQVNPRTIVIVNTGSPVALPFAEDAAAILLSWFGGEELGEAIADVLLGDAEPGGRLPTTWPIELEHTPAFGNFPTETSEVRYGEGLLLGYRWYETRRLPVRFPFGHGCSYSSFTLGAPVLSSATLEPGGTLRVELAVTNTGKRAGSEVLQCYVAPPSRNGTVPGRRFRAEKELRAFAKARLAPGERETVTLVLNERAFAYYDPADEAWATLAPRLLPSHIAPGAAAAHRTRAGWYVDPGVYELHLGRSSAAIAHVVEVTVIGSDEPLDPSVLPA